MSFLAILVVLNLDFSQFEQLFQVPNLPKFKVESLWQCKNGIFEIQILPKLISRKIEWQINSCV